MSIGNHDFWRSMLAFGSVTFQKILDFQKDPLPEGFDPEAAVLAANLPKVKGLEGQRQQH